MKVVWENIYSVGVELIDNQHKHMVELINQGYETIENPTASVEEYAKLLQSLVDHAHEHFATEEKYFKEFDYEFTEEHIEQHQKITADVVDFWKHFDETQSKTIIFEVLQYLDDWLFVHIMQHDKKYVKCFHEHGLS